MRTTVNIDEDLLKKAMEDTGIEEKSRLLNEALRRLTRQEAAKRLIALGGTMPDLEYIRQFRQEPETE